ncbi:hypothetical protein C8J56DRAFT_900542 [Mycena floridula]|nr:hypothetical protein C8J56DRAFT_900542 [Mycena floridula]
MMITAPLTTSVPIGVSLVLLNDQSSFLDSHHLFNIPVNLDLLDFQSGVVRIRADTLLSVVVAANDSAMPDLLASILNKEGPYFTLRLATMRLPCLDATLMRHPCAAFQNLGALDTYQLNQLNLPFPTFNRHSEVLGMVESNIHISVKQFQDLFEIHGVKEAVAHFWLIFMPKSRGTITPTALTSQSSFRPLFSEEETTSAGFSPALFNSLLAGLQTGSSPTHDIFQNTDIAGSSSPASSLSHVDMISTSPESQPATTIQEVCDRLDITQEMMSISKREGASFASWSCTVRLGLSW